MTRYRFSDGGQPHFMTCTIVAWRSIFNCPDAVEIVLSALLVPPRCRTPQTVPPFPTDGPAYFNSATKPACSK